MTHATRTANNFIYLPRVACIPLACVAVLVYVLMLGCVPANALVAHAFDPAATETLNKGGVPVGCAGGKEPPCIWGALGRVEALSAEAGRLWASDEPANSGEKRRIDAFESLAPFGFIAPQLDEGEGGAGVSYIGEKMAVGHVAGSSEDQVYTFALYRSTPTAESQDVIAVYGATSGKLLGTWAGGNTLNKSFTHSGSQLVATIGGVAVDRSPNLSTSGDVYVTTASELQPSLRIVDVFKDEPAGTVGEEPELAATLTGICATAGESCPGKVIPFRHPEGVTVSGVNGDVFVRDGFDEGREVIDVFEPEPGPLHEYVFLRQLTGPPSGKFQEIRQMTVDGGIGPGSGDLYVVNQLSGTVDEFDETGAYIGDLTGTSPSSPFGEFKVLAVAVDPETHRVFVGGNNLAGSSAAVDVFGPDLVVPNVETSAVSGVKVSSSGAIEATLNGAVDPLGEGEAKCGFVWGTTEAFGEPVAKCEPEGVNSSGPVKAKVRLLPDTSYVYRLQASNHNGLNQGEAPQDQRFRTPGPGIHSEFAAGVSSTAASLEAGIDPDNAPTRFYFQYSDSVPMADCEASPGVCQTMPSLPGEMLPAGGGTDAEVGVHVQGLTPNRVYHYRVVAVSELEVEPKTLVPVTFVGADQTFTTQLAGAPLVLADARQWELVSPPDKHGAVLFKPGELVAIAASVSGEALSYAVTLPTEPAAPGYSEGIQVFSTRGADGGWSSRDISTPHSAATGIALGIGLEYRAFSEDLSTGLVEPQGPFTSLAPNVFPADTERTPYIRHDTTCSSEPGTCYEPLATGAEGYADVQEGTKFGGEGKSIYKVLGAVSFVGGSPDLQHVIVEAEVPLTKTAPLGKGELYEWSADKPAQDRLELVSLNEANQPAGTPFLGSRNEIVLGAVSRDGSRVFWSEDGAEGGGLYMRDVPKGVSLRLDRVQPRASGLGSAKPVFQGASADGGRVFFTDEQALTPGSGAANNKPDLYECDVVEEAGGLKCVLHDLTPLNGSEHASLVGPVTGFSKDGSWVYFVANGVLAGTETEGARPGTCPRGGSSVAGKTCNLYVMHDGASGWGQAKLVAVLSDEDKSDWADGEEELSHLTARVSDNGDWLVFMSNRSLTGYDNHDAVSGEPDEEAFLYHASTEGPGRLACASCRPTGARPSGLEWHSIEEFGLVASHQYGWESNSWVAATVPGFDPSKGSTESFYQPRYLSDEGRMFFDSPDALVAQDVNHNEDVYEFEPAGVGDCTTESSGYEAVASGCVGLISSGKAVGESAFVDASETGNEVFFLTGEKLTGNDTDNALDMYDAHLCTSNSPCASEAPSPPACTTADACRAAPEPQPAIFGAPASATFSGAGNLTPPGSAPALAVKPKSLTRAQKLARGLKACHKDKSKHKRVVCERQAHKQYGAKQARTGKAVKKGKG